MGSRPARAMRGTLASAVAIFVAALFHVAGGGAVPGVVPLALSLAFATLASIALTSRRLSLWRLVASVVLSQFLFHALFSLGDGTARFVSADGTSASAVHVHTGSHLTMTGAAMPAGHTDYTAPSMWLTHATAALITVIALRFGERAFWSLFETARLGVLRFARLVAGASPIPVRVVAVVATVAAAEPAHVRDLGLPLARLRHRGPPAVAGAF
ncbi:hypothetical protein [Leifsonia sp. ZF2019]|uniref:hypothetical protein n=1 Tax=Leifsonia sp. ZF2019 TaxID=2781978 RepID=UPI001CBC0B9E|nr:hypothetical protein [Leifsonia sp. ZF2019]